MMGKSLLSTLDKAKARSQKLIQKRVSERPKGTFTVPEFAEYLGVGDDKARTILADMRKNGDVEDVKLYELKGDGLSLKVITGFRLLEPKPKK